MKKIIWIIVIVLICILIGWYIWDFVQKSITPFGAMMSIQRELVVDAPLIFTPTSTMAVDYVPLVRYRAQQNYLCTMPIVEISTKLNMFGATMSVGTTTQAGDVSLTNTSTATLIANTKVATATAPLYFDGFGGYKLDDGTASAAAVPNIITHKGTYYNDNASATTSLWLFNQNDFLVLSWDYSGATSTNSIDVANNFTGVGRIKTNCYPR